ncbi:flagellar biosynthesis protein FlhF [Oceanobacillus jordanicus]|uniref:Flagellar biosynthesis protein FlhF n=1 Tax=Oceanobacillus jordanicus TaxID=2867266 RepID=A0AAW5B488_9BACI|nr:flagellar biosynthesis protein FlhF [Oceanobacillus jordanicus]MCG3419077.1 flagellar biosynthesis protein FlhF [Oceanobacillus jordanicus]
MKVKKYTAATMPEAMKQVRKELGTGAVILNSKEVKHKGFLGLFKKSRIEVVAAHDPDPIRPSNNQMIQDKVANTTKTENKQDGPKKDSDNLVLEEIKQLKKMLHYSTDETSHYPMNYRLVYEGLIAQEVEPILAKQLVDKVMDKASDLEPENVNYRDIVNTLATVLKTELSGFPYKGIEDTKKIAQFVGPTGVGKTTTIAKIAAKCMLEDQKKVALITSDTYRIAAVEQLRTYAKILDVPMEVAYTADDFRQAFEKYANYDVILVDTAGRNFRDEQYIRQLKETTRPEWEMDTYLVLALTAKAEDITTIYDQFSQIGIKEIVFTKTDETRQYGSFLNISLGKQTGIAYATNGQDVPEDLLKLSPSLISDYIVDGLRDV